MGAAFAAVLSGCRQEPYKPPAQNSSNPSKAGVYRGSLDGVSGEYISGWAWDPDHPNDTMTVVIFDGDTLLGETRADSLRKDLAEKKIGTGKYGFAYRIPKSLRDGKAHQIHAKLRGASAELVGSPFTLPAEAAK